MKRIGELAPPRDAWSPEALPTLVRRLGENEWHQVTAIESAAILTPCGGAFRSRYGDGAIYGEVSGKIGTPRCADCERLGSVQLSDRTRHGV